MGRPKLQVALDFYNANGQVALDRALRIANLVNRRVDLIEAGTPLIKSAGMDSVATFREFYGDRVVADMKTLDVGYGEVEMAARAGASIVSISYRGESPTLPRAVEARDDYGVKLMVDLLGVPQEGILDAAMDVKNHGADYVLPHTGVDAQAEGKTPMYNARMVDGEVDMPLAVAGGVNPEMAAELKELENCEIVIVGSHITKAGNPDKAAFDVYQALI